MKLRTLLPCQNRTEAMASSHTTKDYFRNYNIIITIIYIYIHTHTDVAPNNNHWVTEKLVQLQPYLPPVSKKKGKKEKQRKKNKNLISTATKFYKCFLIGSNEIQLKSARYVSVILSNRKQILLDIS